MRGPSVKVGKQWLESAGFTRDFSISDLDTSEAMDAAHILWREKLIAVSDGRLTHGWAAKFINVYIKARFVVGCSASPSRELAHPPIDKLLLRALADNDVGGHRSHWKALLKQGWSNLPSANYMAAIALIRESLAGRPMWMIEKYWRGHQ